MGKRKGKLSKIQEQAYRLDPDWVSRSWSHFPKENFDKYQRLMKKPHRASDIQNLFDAQAINMYGGIPDSTYRRIDNAENQTNYNSLGFYKPNSPNPDRSLPDNIYLSPEASAGTFLHEGAHPFGHHKDVDTKGYEFLNPQDSTAQKIGRTRLGSLLGVGGVKTLDGYIKEYGADAGTEQWNSVHGDSLHPYTTQTFYDKYYEDTSNVPKSLLDSLNTQTYKYADNSPEMQDYRQGIRPELENPLLAGTVKKNNWTSNVKKDGDVIKSVRGWIKNTVPWMKRGEGLIPDDIYKQGSWFGNQGSYDPNNAIIQAGEKLGGMIY